MSRITTLAALLAVTLGLGGCIKSEMKIEFANDNTAKLTESRSFSPEAIDAIISMAGDQMPDEAVEQLEGMGDEMTEEAVRKGMKEVGVEVLTFSDSAPEGWTGYKVTGKIADVNSWIEKSSAKGAKEGESSEGNPLGGALGSMTPKFYKTDKQGVGKIVILPPMTEKLEGMPSPDDMTDEELEMVESQLDMMKTMLSIDKLEASFTVQLPGKILSATGGKIVKDNDKAMEFSIKGANLDLDAVSNMFGMKNGVSATFEIPEDCKITFIDEKKKAEAKEEKPAEEEKKPKKGGLKVGG